MSDSGGSAAWLVERGHPDAAELAALVVALQATARPAAAVSPASPVPSPWADPRLLVRLPPVAGAGAWRASGLPVPR